MSSNCRVVWYSDAAKEVQSLNIDISDTVLAHATLAQYFFVLDPSEYVHYAAIIVASGLTINHKPSLLPLATRQMRRRICSCGAT